MSHVQEVEKRGNCGEQRRGCPAGDQKLATENQKRLANHTQRQKRGRTVRVKAVYDVLESQGGYKPSRCSKRLGTGTIGCGDQLDNHHPRCKTIGMKFLQIIVCLIFLVLLGALQGCSGHGQLAISYHGSVERSPADPEDHQLFNPFPSERPETKATTQDTEPQ